MMHAIVWKNRSLSVSVQSVGLMLAAAAGLSCLSAAAQDLPLVPRAVELAAPGRTLADLEKAFWECDHRATVHGLIDVGSGMLCGVVTEELRLRKFNADFNAMLDWWQQNKAGEYRALDKAHRSARNP